MKKKFYIFVNGILNNPGDVNSWTDCAEAFVELRDPKCHASRFEYASGVFTRRWFQGKRVENLKKVIDRYLSEKVILIGHSNGCDIIERLINKGAKVHEAHLIAAASEADFNKNGFNRALENGMINSIHVYMSPIDLSLKHAHLSTKIFGWLGLGYGYLGLVGPKNVADNLTHKVIVHEKIIEHSDWFNEENFEETMLTIIGK